MFVGNGKLYWAPYLKLIFNLLGCPTRRLASGWEFVALPINQAASNFFAVVFSSSLVT